MIFVIEVCLWINCGAIEKMYVELNDLLCCKYDNHRSNTLIVSKLFDLKFEVTIVNHFYF